MINLRRSLFTLMVLIGITTIASASIVTTGDINPSAPATWTIGTLGEIANVTGGVGTLTIDSGSDVLSNLCRIGSRGNGTATVDGVGSTLTANSVLYVGFAGNGILDVINGGKVSTVTTYIAAYARVGSQATITGAGSVYENSGGLNVKNNGTLNIFDNALVKTKDLTTTNTSTTYAYVNMQDNGQLAISGSGAGSIADFLNLVSGDDAIRYWTGSAWDNIANASSSDYTLEAGTGDLDGYTVLTVVPEPATLSILAIGSLAMLRRRKK